MTKKPKHKLVEVYRDDDREWRFRIRSKNGKIITVSSESYKRERSAVRALHVTIASLEWWSIQP